MATLNLDVLTRSLAGIFLRRDDPVNRWGNLISSYQALPGLRFFAPMSVVGASGQVIDLALGNHLTNNGTAIVTRTGLTPYSVYDGSTQYHNIADTSAHDIIGNEGYIGSGIRGLTIGAWVNPVSVPGANGKILAKGTVTGNARAYALGYTSGDVFTFIISDNGTNQFSADDTSVFLADSWYFLAGRFTPSTEVKLWRGTTSGLTTFTNTTSIPATLNNSATGLGVGAQANGVQFANVRVSMAFVCASALDDATIFGLFEQGRKVYGA